MFIHLSLIYALGSDSASSWSIFTNLICQLLFKGKIEQTDYLTYFNFFIQIFGTNQPSFPRGYGNFTTTSKQSDKMAFIAVLTILHILEEGGLPPKWINLLKICICFESFDFYLLVCARSSLALNFLY